MIENLLINMLKSCPISNIFKFLSFTVYIFALKIISSI